MKIAFFLSSKSIVPPPKTGGVEYAIYSLIRELAKRGHKITVYAAPGSKIPGAECRAISPFPTFSNQKYANLQERITNFYDSIALSEFARGRDWKNFDLIHYGNYLFYEILPFAKLIGKPIIAEINYPHESIYPYIAKDIKKFTNVYFLPVSKYIAANMTGLNFLEPVNPGLDVADFPFGKKVGEYLFVIGRICPAKGIHTAIRVAELAKRKLVIAGPVSEIDQEYYNKEILPNIDNKSVVYLGEIDFETKLKIYKNALATLFPIEWNEPFGLVMIESMACGTPVIAFDRAAVREVIKNQGSGNIVKDGDVVGMAKAVQWAARLNRKKVRQWVEDNFSIQIAVEKYERICIKLIAKK